MTGAEHRTATPKANSEFFGATPPIRRELQRLRTWLAAEVLALNATSERLRELAIEWFVKQSLAPLDPTAREQLLRSAINAFEPELFQSIANLLSAESKASIDTLSKVEGHRQ
ncbi:MAG: hypothetical protein K0R08_2129 [Solimicrobium sp.]|jgi:hypothetical protein|nr:hypothetical protein [Solimicrobium sp.]